MKNFAKIALCAIPLFVGATAASAADLRMPVKAAPMVMGSGKWLNIFGGVTASPHSIYGEAGAVFALNQDLYSDGWLFRIKGGAGHYSYLRAPGFRQGADFQTGDIMVGYQKYYGKTRFSAYGGLNVENHDNSDPFAAVSGTKVGAKFLGEAYSPLSASSYALLTGSYSTAFNNYYVMGKLGFNVLPNVSIGPMVAQLGNKRFDAFQVGPFLAFNLSPSSQFIVGGGYQVDERRDFLNDNSGGFVSVHLRGDF